MISRVLARTLSLALLLTLLPTAARAENGYDLWLRYHPVADASRLAEYRAAFSELVLDASSPTLNAARQELLRGLGGLLDREQSLAATPGGSGALIAGTPGGSALIAALQLAGDLEPLGAEGYLIRTMQVQGRPATVIAANEDIGVLYGAFHLLRLLQMHRPVADLRVLSAPRVEFRMLNHWDNLDRTVERGYAGFSLWDWHHLPDYLSPRYTDYARANASIGVNATALTNVNANAQVLTPVYLPKVSALADVFRPYGIQVFLTARFSAPIEIGETVLMGADIPESQPMRSAYLTLTLDSAEEAERVYALLTEGAIVSTGERRWRKYRLADKGHSH